MMFLYGLKVTLDLYRVVFLCTYWNIFNSDDLDETTEVLTDINFSTGN